MKIKFADQDFVMDGSGALYWPDQNMIIIADAHLEKGSYFAQHGFFVPPYDTHSTLIKINDIVQKYSATTLLILGDFLHDNHAVDRMHKDDRVILERIKQMNIIWIRGNHDDDYAPTGVDVLNDYECAGITFRHEAIDTPHPEISGHYHPKSEFVYKGKVFRERCFIEDGSKFMLPAFGAYTGGLSINDKVIRSLFGMALRKYIVINDRVIPVPDDQTSV